MQIGDCQSTEDAVTALLNMKVYRPFQWGGTWFVSAWGGVGYCYRSMTNLKAKAVKDGQAFISVMKVSPKD